MAAQSGTGAAIDSTQLPLGGLATASGSYGSSADPPDHAVCRQEGQLPYIIDTVHGNGLTCRLAALMLLMGNLLAAARTSTAATSAPGGEVIFVGAGDIANCTLTQDSATASLLDVISGTVYTLGDNAYEHGTRDEFNNCYAPAWGRHKARTKPVPGNHEYHTSGASGYYGYFGAAASPLDTNCASACKGYYSYDLGGWHIVALNSEIDRSASSAQIAWLKADLAASSSACTLAYWHKPLYSSGVHGNNTSQQPFWDVLYRFGADIVLNGHDHHYERFAPQSPSGAFDPTHGIRQFVVGTGGAGLRALVTTRPNSEVRNSDTHGVLRIVLRDGGYSWNFVPVAGKTFTDAGSASCVDDTKPAPVGYWRMDPVLSGGTRTTNLATGSVDATYQGGAVPGAQPPDNNMGLPSVAHPGARAKNKATASFDGTGEYIEVDVNSGPALSNTMTVAAWVKLSNPSGDQKVVGRMMVNDPIQRSGFLLSVVGGELQADVYDAGNTHYLLTGGTVVTDTWTHVAATWQTGGALAIYINGVQVLTRTASALPIGNSSLPGNGDRVVIGGAPWAPALYNLAGSVDEVMIFDRALSPTDIALIARRTFIVNSASNSVTTCDGDACSLKTAIEHANAAPNGALKDRIHFDLPAPAVIQPDNALPTITDAVRIDGLTQPGASCVAWPPMVIVALADQSECDP
jgi:Concanavalin A-like lectin/glucanases superfamily/Calcineurin-like phosphoesterase